MVELVYISIDVNFIFFDKQRLELTNVKILCSSKNHDLNDIYLSPSRFYNQIKKNALESKLT